MNPGYSNYPRAGAAQIGQRPPGAHFDFISESFTIIRSDLGTWVAVSLLTLLVTYAVSIPLSFVGNLLTYGSFLGGAAPGASTVPNLLGVGFSIVTTALTYALSFLLLVGQGMMGLAAARGARPQVMDLFAPFRLFVPVFVTSLAVSILIFLGLVLLILPGIIAVGLLVMAPFAAYDQRLSPGDAIRWSVEQSKPHMWGIFGLGFVASIVSGLGVLLCCVGYLFTAPVFGIVLGLTYGTFAAPSLAPFMPYPPTGPVSAPAYPPTETPRSPYPPTSAPTPPSASNPAPSSGTDSGWTQPPSSQPPSSEDPPSSPPPASGV